MTRTKMAGSLVVLLALLVVLVPAQIAQAAPIAPEPTLSLYVSTATNAQLCDWGSSIAAGQNASPPTVAADAFIIMHFFAPWKSDTGAYGASRQRNFQTTGQLRAAAQNLGLCWFNATGSR
jgi:hypothetical protein